MKFCGTQLVAFCNNMDTHPSILQNYLHFASFIAIQSTRGMAVLFPTYRMKERDRPEIGR